MTQSHLQHSSQQTPTPILISSSLELATTRLIGVLETLKAEQRIENYVLRPTWEDTASSSLGVTVFSTADYEAEQTLRQIVRLSMSGAGHWVDLDLENPHA
jgi:hypothetical protein